MKSAPKVAAVKRFLRPQVAPVKSAPKVAAVKGAPKPTVAKMRQEAATQHKTDRQAEVSRARPPKSTLNQFQLSSSLALSAQKCLAFLWHSPAFGNRPH